MSSAGDAVRATVQQTLVTHTSMDGGDLGVLNSRFSLSLRTSCIDGRGVRDESKQYNLRLRNESCI
eukprot:36828-Eustigmatos_ZCMA.PRE.1